ncbi:hypothetical protein [Ekhidna sp.]
MKALKNGILILALSGMLFMYGCSSDDGESLPSQLIINFPENYLFDTQIGHVYLTDESGNIVSESVIQNNSQVVLEADFGLSGKRFDLTFFREFTFSTGYVSKTYNTFINAEAGKLDFSDSEPTITTGTATIQVNNTGSSISGINGLCCYSGSATISPNEATINVDLREGNNIYLLLQNETEAFKRYYLERGVDNNFSIELEYSDIPIVTNPFEISFPDEEIFTSTVRGYIIDESKENEFTISRESGTTIPGQKIQHFIPENTFVISSVDNRIIATPNTYRVREETNAIDEIFSIPSLDFNLVNSDPANVEISSSSDYSLFNFSFRNSNEEYGVDWILVGRQNDIGNIGIPQAIANRVEEEIDGFSLQDLEIRFGNLFKYSDEPTFEELFEGRDYQKIESLSRNLR